MAAELEIIDRSEEWAAFLKKKYKTELNKLAREYPHTKSLTIGYDILEGYGKTGIILADELLERPGKTLEDIRDAIRTAHLISRKDREGNDISEDVINGINIRFIHLPRKTQIRDIRAEHINKFISVDGIIRRVTEVRPRLVIGAFRCSAGHFTYKAQDYGTYSEPDVCGNAECTQKKLELVQNRSTFIDSQKLRIQETPEGLRGGEQPQNIDIDVVDDLCGIVSPGDRVIINGILRSVQRITGGQKSTVFDLFIECNSIEISIKEFEEVNITEEDEETIKEMATDPAVYGKIARSIAPTIYGNDEVKEAIALQMFGGIAKEMPDGSSLRGDIHVLLVGDPGIAKSQLLRYVIKLAPRGIYTSGKSASSAGLTAAAVKDDLGDGRWTLEAGALVLADKGIAAVDEMDKMQKDDRSSLHEAMEQQSISVAKAGINATLRTRCSLLGAANPKLGRFDEFTNISEQVNMPPSLLSRFDLIFIMKDKPDAVRDLNIANHILKSHMAGEKIMHHKKHPIPGADDEYFKRELAPVMPEIDAVLLRKYLAYAKRNCFPMLTDEAKDILVQYYQSLRGVAIDSDKPVPVTARQLEALVRLAEASARVRLSDEISVDDAKRVVKIVDTCLRQVAYDPATGQIDIDKVATGISKSSRDMTRVLRETIKILSEGGSSAKLDKVIDTMVSQHHYGKEEVEKLLDKMKRQGDIITPRNDTVKLLGGKHPWHPTEKTQYLTQQSNLAHSTTSL
ncbi:MAG TPA: minichromosome maintenance protein MCM [Methanocorpusculum sp.]|nr:minichromosome maintenance protein MCM [Methanocorpusculum sp.]